MIAMATLPASGVIVIVISSNNKFRRCTMLTWIKIYAYRVVVAIYISYYDET